jgi:23S rRNA pseudouridine1911/1915/1917 synthase
MNQTSIPTLIPTLELKTQVRFQAPISGRLDHLIRQVFKLSHKRARKLITTGKIKVRTRLHRQWETQVNQSDWIEVNLNASNPKKKEVFNAHLVHHDDSFVVISKPSGLLSVPGHQSDEPSALQAAHRLCKGPRRPRVVHRLDKETSGLLIFPRTIPATRVLQDALQNREVKRVYRCIVKGLVQEDSGYISSGLLRKTIKGRRGSAPLSLKRHALTHPPEFREVEGKWALTLYRVVQRGTNSTALEVELLTGRTHQIRIHLAEIGHPILGEWVYASCRKLSYRLALHAAELHFKHPFSGHPLSFKSPWPKELSRLQPLPKGWMWES